jgi:hypothetical protein
MLELTMAAFRPDAIPAVGLQALDDVANLHTSTIQEEKGVVFYLQATAALRPVTDNEWLALRVHELKKCFQLLVAEIAREGTADQPLGGSLLGGVYHAGGEIVGNVQLRIRQTDKHLASRHQERANHDGDAADGDVLYDRPANA